VPRPAERRYAPPDFALNKFEDDLGHQNSLIHKDWQVYRRSDRQLAREPKRVKDQHARDCESDR
jgi:hypothetical protein